MYQIYPVSEVVGESTAWGGADISHQVVCPMCRSNFAHPSNVRQVSSDDSYRAGWPGRGDLTVLGFEGECGHDWEICFGFHKGEVFTFARVLGDEVP